MKSITKILIVLEIIVAVIFASSCSNRLLDTVLEDVFKIRQGTDIEYSSVLILEADAEIVTEEQMNTVVTIMRKRLDSAGYTEATVAVQGEKRVRIEIPSVSNPDDAVKLLGQTGKLVFVDSEGNVVLEGTDIKKAQHLYDRLSEMTPAENYVELTFKPESIKKFAEATKAAANKEAGQNFIAILLDETVISKPAVDAQYASEGINSETAVISGEFTAEEAAELANLINAGQLPFGLKLVESK